STVETWRKEREASLRGEHGWLSIIGLHWLKPGKNGIGAAKENLVQLPQATCTTCAQIEVSADKLVLHPSSKEPVLVDGKPLEAPSAIEPGKPFHSGRFKLAAVKRTSGYAVRVWDPESATRKSFKGCQWYPVNRAFSVR